MNNFIQHFEEVRAAGARIESSIHKTPLLQSRRLSQLVGCDLYVKAEHLQKTGSFKARGAMNFILSEPEKRGPVATFSSGNHGQAVAWAGAKAGRAVTVFMPEDANPEKRAAIEAYGGSVHLAGRTSLDRQAACEAFCNETGAGIIPAYDHERIIAGQGTAMIEVLEDLPVFDAALIPVGGGGLISGNSIVLKVLRPGTEIYACEPEQGDDARRSLETGKHLETTFPETMAEGARNLKTGDRNWAIIKDAVKSGLACSDAQILEAMQLYSRYLKQWVEPTGAVSLACLLQEKGRFQGQKVVIYATGGNIGARDYARLMEGA